MKKEQNNTEKSKEKQVNHKYWHCIRMCQFLFSTIRTNVDRFGLLACRSTAYNLSVNHTVVYYTNGEFDPRRRRRRENKQTEEVFRSHFR
jgi:hypothetical protein